ncbi:tetratricopeptide repeat protein [Virgibacillus ndiopensis]|uniref:tetratricopeptide repeat protein n=1 Tax=Virgibacillus ndiopensis TaxID=2004408 RepID=UPI000C077E4B|nr:tetratricopeptide repeat protein [Virgibacillus ndiopensis]
MDKNTQAIEYMREQKYEESARLFTEVIEENPDDPVGYINFGNLLIHIHELTRAENFFQRAIEIDEHAATAYYGLGNLYFEQSLYPKAAENFKKAIELGLEESDVYYMLGMTFQKQDQLKLSLPYLLRASEMDKDDDEVLFQYGLALAQCNHIEEADSVFKSVLKKNSEHSDAHYNLGVIALYNDDAMGALDHFNKAITIQPDHILAANGKKQVEALLKQNEA